MTTALLLLVALAFPSSEDVEDAPQPAPAQAPAPATPAAPVAEAASRQVLVSGAPLSNPNVAVHIVEQKEFSDKSVRELTLFPAVAQVNGKFTNHVGVAAAFTWHLQENFALMAMGLWNYVARESDFNAELVDKVRAEAQAATSLLLVGGALAGVEVTPFYGKFVFYDSWLVHFAIVLSAGAGAGMTSHQLKPANDAGRATFGETGWRFLAEIGGGFRVQFARWITLRLELRDLVYTARVDSVNGCNNTDLGALDEATKMNRQLDTVPVAPGCQISRFEGVDDQGDDDPSNDRKRSTDLPLARALVKIPSSDVLNNLGVYLGVSLTF